MPRHVLTQPFQLSVAEKELYDTVTRYVNTYLGASAAGGAGRRSRWPGRCCSVVLPQASVLSAPLWPSEPGASKSEPMSWSG